MARTQTPDAAKDFAGDIDKNTKPGAFDVITVVGTGKSVNWPVDREVKLIRLGAQSLLDSGIIVEKK